MIRQPTVILIIVFTLLSFRITAQPYTISGRVIDSETTQPLAFVNIVVNSGQTGGVSDIDGRFHIVSKEPVEYLQFSYVGYSQQCIIVKDPGWKAEIRMEKLTMQLPELVIAAGENPAHRIIENTISYRDRNNYERLPSFAYTSYDKMIFTVDADSLMKTDTVSADSSFIRLKELLDEQHLFMMETVAKRRFLYPGRNHQTVVASRVSGLKDPVFTFLISQLQSTSFYGDIISISDKNYLNPISKGSTTRYTFMMEDTLLMAGSHDTTFIISYRPKRNTNFDGLRGLLYINTNRWAIQNVIAEPAMQEKGMSVRIQQMYTLIDSVYWFPVQLNTDIIFKNIKVNDFYPIGQGKSYITDIELNPQLVRRMFNEVSLEVEPGAASRSQAEWERMRTFDLTEKDQRTYHVLDSLGQALKFDRIARMTEALLNGNIPLGWLNIPMHRVMRYNDHEKLYLGLGLTSNQQISRIISAGVYAGYGFGDRKVKYGGEVRIYMHHFRDAGWFLRYENDVSEAGNIESFDGKAGLLNKNAYRNLLINKMDHIKTIASGIQYRVLPYVLAGAEFHRTWNAPQYCYTYSKPTGESFTNAYIFTEMRAGFRFIWREKILQTTRSRISLGSDYPSVRFQFTKGFEGILNGSFPYHRYELKIEYAFYRKLAGKSTLQLSAGLIDSNVPYQKLFTGFGSYSRIAIHSPGSFATMRMNEFSADRYVCIYLTHNFGKLLVRTKKFEPEFLIVTNAGLGWLQKQDQQYHSIDLQDFRNGFFESGLLINNLINLQFYNLGAGAFYRYGNYSLESFKKNISWQINLNFPF